MNQKKLKLELDNQNYNNNNSSDQIENNQNFSFEFSPPLEDRNSAYETENRKEFEAGEEEEEDSEELMDENEIEVDKKLFNPDDDINENDLELIVGNYKQMHIFLTHKKSFCFFINNSKLKFYD